MNATAHEKRREALPSSGTDAPDRSSASWAFALTGVVFVGLVLTTGGLPEPGWRWAVAAVGFLGAVGSWRNRLPTAFTVMFVLASVRLGIGRFVGTESPGGGTWEAGLNLAVGVALCLLLVVGFQYRNGSLGARDLVDVAAVVIGSGVVAWIAVAQPLVESGAASPALAALIAGYLPIASLLVVLTIDIAFSGLSGNRTMWLATAAATVHLTATWVWELGASGRLPTAAEEVGVAGNVAALCLLAAAMAHPDASRTLVPVDPERASSDTVIRVVVLGICTIVPVSLIATTPPSSRSDTAVRATGIGLLIVAVVARLLLATHHSRQAREALLQQVTRDDLTRLPNRSRFLEEVAEVLESTWHSPVRATVVQLNLDRFKNINDSFGHYAANEVLVVVSNRLRAVAESSGAVVARVGGDDFALVHADTRSPDEALEHAERVRAALASPITVGDASVFVSASIGVAMAPRNRTTAAEDLMRHADIAAHQAKQNGRNRVEMFDQSMQARLTHRMDVEHALHGAIGRQEMRLYHQPIVDIVSGRVSGFEALMRWVRQDGTLVSPADFIPVAEETGIICELGAWALRDALGELRRWIDDGIVPPTTTMSVNVSPRQVADPAFATIVRGAVTESGVPPHLLWLEITESMMLDEPELAASILDEVRSMGVRIAMDDFGTGFSSLSVLQQFPIHRIKIDRAFVHGLGDGDNDRSLVRTIIAMAHSMALDLVAEGVETVQQLEALRELGCDKAQGYLISRPVPSDAMRSTMVAIDEMASLSIFAAPSTPSPVAEMPAEPTPRTTPFRRPFATTGPIGPLSSRPLGGPML